MNDHPAGDDEKRIALINQKLSLARTILAITVSFFVGAATVFWWGWGILTKDFVRYDDNVYITGKGLPDNLKFVTHGGAEGSGSLVLNPNAANKNEPIVFELKKAK